MKYLALLFFTFFTFTDLFAQYNNLTALGDKEFKDANYYQAAHYYEMAADKKNSRNSIPFYSAGKVSKAKLKAENIYICYQLAESYRLCRNFQSAGQWYYKILNGTKEGIYPLARLWYGQCLRAEARFDEGLQLLQQFKTTYKGRREFIAIADREIATCLFAKAQYSQSKPVKITKMQGSWNIEAGNYAITKNGGNYWFTSTRLAENSKTHLNNIFYAPGQKSYAPVLVNFKANRNIKDIEYGTPSIAASGKTMYVTGWYKKDHKTTLIIYARVLHNNKWSPLVKLNANVNTEGSNALQPCITGDGKRLFFASDKPGGQGGYDIWVSDLDDAGNPINSTNLGNTVNTALDEEAPFYDNVHKKLVFSSKGFTGLGGFDFFESYENTGNWSVPENLGYPINSSKDDLYYYADPDDESKFYISSDRESDCCLSLFELQYKLLVISGNIVNCDSAKTLADVNVSIVDSISGKVLKHALTSPTGNYHFEILKNGPFKLAIEKEGYFKRNISITTNKDTIKVPDQCLTAFKINKAIVLKNIFYDFNSAGLRPEAKTALDSLVTILRDNPKIKIELASHTDSIGTEAYNLRLSQQRAQICVDYIISKNIDQERVSAKGYGKSKPIASNSLPDGKDNPAGRQLNRRTEFVVKE